MIDKTAPYNQLRKLPPQANFDDISIVKQVNITNKAIFQLNGLIRSLENPEIILEPLKVKEAVESSGIENINTTISNAFYTQSKLMETTQIRSNKTALEYMNALEDEGILKTSESK